MTDPASDQAFLDELRAAVTSAVAANGLGGANAMDSLLDGIVRTAARAIPCPEGALLLVDHERQVLTFEVLIGVTAATAKDLTVPLGHGVAGLVAASGQALAVANAQEDPRHARDVAETSGYLPTTILAVPVTARDGTTLGVLELLDRQGQPTFSLADIELLGMFAEQAAAVLETRRGHDSLAGRLASVLGSLTGVPDEARARLTDVAEGLAARADADPASQRTIDLAELVATIASRGPAEHEMCTQVLSAIATYLDNRPTPGLGVFR